MSNDKYDETLWDEIPGYAFMALGRRGREEVSLDECFVPGCENTDQGKLHPIEKKVESKKNEEKQTEVRKVKFLIHCDDCGKNFHLVFTRHYDLEGKEEEDHESAMVMEEVSASDADDNENYGNIGYIQRR